jgi:phospholipid/cholesterol/gamma-HCH transport system permease protein
MQGQDFLFCALKALAFGVIICLVSCFFGFKAGKGPEGVGRATNSAVVTVSVAVVFLNYFLSQAFYG